MGSTTELWNRIYKSDQYKLFKRLVRKRDEYKCRHCNSKGTRNRSNRLHVHHILPKAKFLGHIFDVENGMVLCNKCHIAEHKKLREIGADFSHKPSATVDELKALIKTLTFRMYSSYIRRKRTPKKSRYKNSNRVRNK